MNKKALELYNKLFPEFDGTKMSDRHTLKDIEDFIEKNFFTAEDVANILNEYCESKIE